MDFVSIFTVVYSTVVFGVLSWMIFDQVKRELVFRHYVKTYHNRLLVLRARGEKLFDLLEKSNSFEDTERIERVIRLNMERMEEILEKGTQYLRSKNVPGA